MKVLGIMGSPRMQGNTDLLLDEALRGAEEGGAVTEKLLVDRLNITPCKEIYQCSRDGTCPLQDDMQGVYEKILAADGIIVASPIFFYTVSPQLLQLVSRCQALWARRHILKNLDIPIKKGVFIGVGATKGARLFDGPKLTIKYFFDAISTEYTADLLIRGVDRKAEIKDHPELLEQARAAGRSIVSG